LRTTESFFFPQGHASRGGAWRRRPHGLWDRAHQLVRADCKVSPEGTRAGCAVRVGDHALRGPAGMSEVGDHDAPSGAGEDDDGEAQGRAASPACKDSGVAPPGVRFSLKPALHPCERQTGDVMARETACQAHSPACKKGRYGVR